MHRFYSEFMEYLEAENREGSLNFVLSKLENNELDIVTLYTEILGPSLNSMKPVENDTTFIWREHVRSSIIRTLIENCYIYVIKERDEKYKLKIGKKVAVVCPTEEYHEIGARMVTDFFALLGYNSTFVGSNTPKDEFVEALKVINLDYIALSISNHYNLVAARKAIEKIKESNSTVKIIVGGNALKNMETGYNALKADMYIETFEDIMKLAQEDKV